MKNIEGTRRTSLSSRLGKAILQTSVTLAVAAGAVGIGLTGYEALAARTSAEAGPPPAPLTSVTPETITILEEVTVKRRFTGQFEAAQDVALGFEEAGTIAAILVREGDRVRKDDVIARLDTRILKTEQTRLAASRKALEAQAELARRTNERQVTLLKQGHGTEQRVDETSLLLAQLEAAIAETDAGLSTVAVRLQKSEIRAPFDGRIGLRDLDAGAIASPGRTVVTLLEDAPARFRVALDPKLAARLGTGARVSIETGGRLLPATLVELAPELDPATRSQLAYFELSAGAESPPARSAGEVVLNDTLRKSGAWVPISAMRQGPRGAWTLLTLLRDDGDAASVGIEAVELLHVDNGRAFVRGTFTDGTLFVPAGTHRVVPGETVRLTGAGA